MSRFCTKCGKELSPDGVCNSCPKTSDNSGVAAVLKTLKDFVFRIFIRMGLGWDPKEKSDSLVLNKNIVPDIITPNQNEIHIKQYKLAKLRSRILGKYADGVLAVTNQRLIFFASGLSYTGKIMTLSEFNIDEVGGIEIKKGCRVSFLNIILGFVFSVIVASIFEAPFSALNKVSSLLALVLGITMMLVLIAPFFLIKKNFWIKLALTSAALGISDGITSLSETAIDYLLGRAIYSFTDSIATVVGVIWIWSLILVCLVPDLRFIAKSKGGSESIEVRRKIWRIFKESKEYSGFSEVIPDEDVYKLSGELGTMIRDLQTMGDMAIEKWKEK